MREAQVRVKNMRVKEVPGVDEANEKQSEIRSF